MLEKHPVMRIVACDFLQCKIGKPGVHLSSDLRMRDGPFSGRELPAWLAAERRWRAAGMAQAAPGAWSR